MSEIDCTMCKCGKIFATDNGQICPNCREAFCSDCPDQCQKCGGVMLSIKKYLKKIIEEGS